MIECASWNDRAMDDVIRLRCRNAPVEIRRNIDARREARGLAPLWPSISRRNIAARARAAATIKRLQAFLAETRQAVDRTKSARQGDSPLRSRASFSAVP